MRPRLLLATFPLLLALAACGDDGGGGGTAADATTDVTTSVTQGSGTTGSTPPAAAGGFCEQIDGLRAYYDTVAPEDALSIEFLRENRRLLGGVTDLPPALAEAWPENLAQQDETIRIMEEAGATNAIDAPPEVFDQLAAQSATAALISSTVQTQCGFTLTFGG